MTTNTSATSAAVKILYTCPMLMMDTFPNVTPNANGVNMRITGRMGTLNQNLIRQLTPPASLEDDMDHEQLMLITKHMPMKTIMVNDEGYLERYFVGQNEYGDQDWLHRFLRADSERHLHSHPWHADSTILCGWYAEEVNGTHSTFRKTWYAGDVNAIVPERIHRIVDVQPNTWSHMRVLAGREPQWYFIDDKGLKSWQKSADADWYKQCKPRGY